MQFAGPISGILSFMQARKQAKVQEANSRVEASTAQYNSSQRQKQRLANLDRLSAANRARSGASGTTYGGSSAALGETNIGITDAANFEDIFNTDNKRATINEAGEAKAHATRLRGFNSLLSGFSDY